MDNEEELHQGQATEATEQPAATTPEPAEQPAQPRSLAEAFAAIRNDDRAAAQSNVSEQPEPSDGGDQPAEHPVDGGSPAPASTGEVEHTEAPVAARPEPSPRQPQQLQPVDPRNDPLFNQVGNALQQQAQALTASQMKEHGYRTIDLSELYEQDERTGRVTFRNPDDPERPFASRVEAQQFVDTFNSQIEREIQRRNVDNFQDLVQENQDVINLIAFNPTYEAMDETVRMYFEALIEPYQQTRPDGTIVFPGVDFQQMARQAQNIALLNARAQGQQQAQKQAQAAPASAQSKGPALDLKGTGSTKADNPEPRNIGEALKMINEKRAADRKSKKGRK